MTLAYLATFIIAVVLTLTAGIFWAAMFAVTLGASAFLLWQFVRREDVFGGPLSDEWDVRR